MTNILRVGQQRIHRHDVAGMVIRRVLVGLDLSVERPLADPNDQRTRTDDLPGDPLAVFLESVSRHRSVDQAPVGRGAGIDPLAGEQHLQGALAADGSAHRHHRGFHAGRAERRALLGEGEIAGGDQLAASGRGDPAHHGDDRLRNALDHAHQRDALVEDALIVARRPVDQLAEIMAGREDRAVGGQNDHPDVAALADVGQGARQLLHEFKRQCIPLLGAV